MRSAHFYNQPVRSLQSMLHSIALSNDNYDTVIDDGIYGPETASAVSTFQRNHALPVTGVADWETWQQIVSLFNLTQINTDPAWPIIINMDVGESYQRGDSHPNIQLIQCMLRSIADSFHATAKPEVTGVLDEVTCTAISDFQSLSGLPVTGSVDKRTWKHLALHYPAAVYYCTE